MKRRGVPAFTAMIVVMAAALFAYWIFAAVAKPPPHVRPEATACASDAPLNAPCQRTVAVKVAAILDSSRGRSRWENSEDRFDWAELTGLPIKFRYVAFGPQDWVRIAPRKGQHATATLWEGRVVKLVTANGSAYTVGNAPTSRYDGIPASLILLVLLLVLARMQRVRPRPGKHARLLRVADVVTVPALIAVTVFMEVYRDRPAVLTLVLVGSLALAAQLSGLAWSPDARAFRPGRARSTGSSRASTPFWSNSVRSATCPIGTDERRWIDRGLKWFSREFDEVPRASVRPASVLLPGGWTGSSGEITELLARICRVMGIDRTRIELDLHPFDRPTRSRRHAVAYYSCRNGREVVEVDLAQVGDPARIAAILAHELAHARLIGERRTLPAFAAGTGQSERLTDLLTVYLGMGILTANAALEFARADRTWTAEPLGSLNDQMLNGAHTHDHSNLGYLNQREFAYALARCCRLRDTETPDWLPALRPGVRAAMRQSLRFLRT